jgi:hypothetical protein
MTRLIDFLSDGEIYQSAILLLHRQFNIGEERPQIEDLKRVAKSNTYYGWVVKYTGDKVDNPRYGFLVHEGMDKPKRLIKLQNKGKEDRPIYLGKSNFNDHVFGMSNENGEPHFLPEHSAFEAAKTLGFNY